MDDIDLYAWRDKYARDFKLRAQQTRSRLTDICDAEPELVDGRYFYFDTMGTTSPVPKQSLAGPTPDISMSDERRRGTRAPWHWGKLYDDDQIDRLIAHPKPKQQQNAVAGFNRQQDAVIIAASINPVIVINGAGAEVSTPLPASQVKTEGGTNGLTIAKLLTMREMYDDAEVDESEFDMNGQLVPGRDSRNLIVGSRQISDLLNDTKISSADFNTVKALQAGAIAGFMGFRFTRLGTLPKAGNMRKVIGLAKGAIGMLPAVEPTVELAKRADKSFAWQLYLKRNMGAVRIEDVRVITQECYEAP